MKCLKLSSDKKVEAVVLPAPIALYYAAHAGRGRVKTVSPNLILHQPLSWCRWQSPLRRKINLALIALRENGTYQRIDDKWFGTGAP